ncbi:MAG: hypothetical protein DRJ40_10920 [Thermoprotei archaeon]|nr:MAG: hypothetical protein DRJ40_10920 [Thermoprotei archaeon]
MKTGKAIVLFILGLVLALLVFPTAWSVSAGLGYVFAIVSIIIGAYLIAKREGRTLPLVLGIILLIVAVPALLGTAAIHMGLWAVKKAVEEATETKSITARIGEPIRAGNWEITVLKIDEAEYIKKDDSYYKAKEGKKLVLVKLRIKNIGKEAKTASDIWNFMLVSNANKSYEKAYTYELEYIWDVTDEIKSKAIVFEELDTTASVAPNTIIEGYLLFQIPVSEEPAKLYFKVGVIGGYEVTIELTK